MGQTKKPYATLGQHLKTARQQAKRTIAEVSGAVEIDEKQLRLIEAGLKRPDEDIMLLLISYFNIADQEALHLWELANYDSDLAEHLMLDQKDDSDGNILAQLMSKPMVMLLTADMRIIYSDGFEASWNQAGMTLNFTQAANNNGTHQNLSVAKVGMSLTQAEKVLEGLQLAILHAKYSGVKLLPPSTNS